MTSKKSTQFAGKLLEHHSKHGASGDSKDFSYTFDAECEKGKLVLIDHNSKFFTNLACNFKGKGKCEVKKAKFQVSGLEKNSHALNNNFLVTDYNLTEKGKKIGSGNFSVVLKGDGSHGFNHGELSQLKKPLLQKSFKSSLEGNNPIKFFVPFLDYKRRLSYGGTKQAIVDTCIRKVIISQISSLQSTPTKKTDSKGSKSVVFSKSAVEGRKKVVSGGNKKEQGKAQKKVKTM